MQRLCHTANLCKDITYYHIKKPAEESAGHIIYKFFILSANRYKHLLDISYILSECLVS